jgi:MFS family permease
MAGYSQHDSFLASLNVESFPEVSGSPPTNRESSNRTTGLYLISIWYKREESQKRFTVYWCSILTASAFGGLLASAIAKMEGVRGLHNWQWIFILEGILTILIGIAAFFLVSDFPEDAGWLTEEERKFVIARAGGDDAPQHITSRHIVVFFKDIKNLLGGIMYLCEFHTTFLKHSATDRSSCSTCHSRLL